MRHVFRRAAHAFLAGPAATTGSRMPSRFFLQLLPPVDQRLLEDLTVNETSFFRNKAQLELFHHHILDELIRKKEADGQRDIRIWSAGCSTGQEPYTIAMLIADALAYHQLRMPSAGETVWPKPLVPPPWKVEIPASDINYSVLRAGQEGVYTETQMSSVDYSYRLRYFDKVGERYAVKKAVKELVHFDFHNLKTQFLPQRNDVIFCRNVMMYFDEAEQRRLIEKFYCCLAPGGYLLVGHAESLLGLTDKFAMVYRNSGTAYRRIEVSQ
jgi:chemotaxis protein methyltransferase CheR